jgi:hypothetical protein
MRELTTGKEDLGERQKGIAVSLAKLRTSFRATGPQIFQLGDIIEVQVSFIAIPMRGKKWKISTILRSISLFEGRFTQVKNAVRYQVKS